MRREDVLLNCRFDDFRLAGVSVRLKRTILLQASGLTFTPSIDLFLTYINTHLPRQDMPTWKI